MLSSRKFFFVLLSGAFLTVFSTVSIYSVFATSPQLKVGGVEAFKFYKEISPNVFRPTVIEVPFSQELFSISVFAVYNVTTSLFEPNLLYVNFLETVSRIDTSVALGSPTLMHDGNFGTYVEFPLTADVNTSEITFRYDKPITASSLSFTLDNYVALPQRISVRAVSDSGNESIVLAPIQPFQGNVLFPRTTSSIWRITFDYVQPLRISEIKFNEQSSGQTTSQGLRFLAHPGQKYQIYFNADRYVQPVRTEAGDLSSNLGVVQMDGTGPIANPEYKPADSDLDLVADLNDNCISVSNTDQKDTDRNGRGDACEDYDRDGMVMASDNCLEIPNRSQEDIDKDGVGDICDDLDNRVTERMPWLPWVGIGVAGVVLLGLFVITIQHKKS